MEKGTLHGPKVIVSGILGPVASWLGHLAYPVYLLVLMGIVDYITGVIAAKYRGQKRSSLIGLQGIVKKLALLLLVFLGRVVDWVIEYTADTVGLDYRSKFIVAAMVAVWLICNEIISVLENLGDIGVKLPPLLTRMVQWVQCQSQLSGDCQEAKPLQAPAPEERPKQDQIQEQEDPHA